MKGTPDYLAPEIDKLIEDFKSGVIKVEDLKNIENNLGYTLKADIYSLGIILFFLFNNRPAKKIFKT